MTPPAADVVVCSQLHRAIQTAQLLYPTHTIYVVCGLNEWIPGWSNAPRPQKEQLSRLGEDDATTRINYSFVKPADCGFFRSVDAAVFEACLDEVLKVHPAQTVAVISHSQWMSHYLGLRDLDNLGQHTSNL